LRRAALILAALALPALAAPAAAAPVRRAPPAARDWSRNVVATPEGGFRMGDPAAPVKLVEYGSLTCPHCAAFSREGTPQLVAHYVRTGKVSYEYRNFILNGIDVTASLLARCSGPAGFFPMAATLYATQPQWIGRIAGMSAAQKDALKALPEGQRLVRLGEIGGLLPVAAGYGVAPARGKQCLASPAGLDRLGKMAEAAHALGVDGTPTFFLNGRMLDVNEWPAVEPLIRQAAGG
jgi:protein-disulfide isomerase